VAHFSHRAVAVVSHDLNQDSDTAGSVALVGQLLHVVGFTGAGAAGDGAVDGVAGHIGVQGLVHCRAQAGVVFRGGTALLGGYHQFPDKLGEHLAALGILGRLAVLDIGPFTVTRH
jgi:hypothetical protein